MFEYRVGQPYGSQRRVWPEGVEYNYRDGAHELRLFFQHPNAAEIAGVSKGKVRFALHVTPNNAIITLLFRFPNMEWSDAPYTYHMVPPDQQRLPPDVTGATRAVLTIFLIDAATGILRAIRLVTFTPEFTRVLHAAIRTQAQLPFDQAQYDRELALVRRRYPVAADLAKEAIVRCVGGDDAAPPPTTRKAMP